MIAKKEERNKQKTKRGLINERKKVGIGRKGECIEGFLSFYSIKGRKKSYERKKIEYKGK